MAGMWITRLGIKGHEVNNQAKGEVLPGQTILRREIWSSLPDDVLDRVIARLPLQYLIRMQSVCKKWKIKLRTSSFIRLCEAESETAPAEWFLTFGQQKVGTVCFAYDVQLSKWYSLPLGFLPFDLNTKAPLAAADGLICLGAGWNATARGVMPTKLIICNPLSRFWRDVPSPPQLDPATSLVSVAGLVVDRFAGTYKLIVIGEVRREDSSSSREYKVLVAYIFDSVSQDWKSYEAELDPLDSFTSFLASHFRTLVGHSIRAVLCSAVCEGVLYCLTARPYQLHAFNVVNEEWNRLKISLPAEISGPSLVARPGHLFLVGAYRHNQHDKSNNIGIWELDEDTRRWNVVDILLEAMCSGRRSPPKSPPRSFRRDDNDDVILFVKWATRFLAYNVSKKSWVWLPPCVPTAPGAAPVSQPYHNGYVFTPSLLLP
uniref:F-box domain-containing protein n=2 Tax=Physcomitrium patens TaxID=3218 RepID=A0A7I3YYX3_PHYPA|nr:F-box/kelch-repeat protein At5g15710-like [Physcomitrium patens]|eukprot:XP_024363967.1 F-box/kelch-repeat protein At5g15710-like [Physcomitrella patens]